MDSSAYFDVRQELCSDLTELISRCSAKLASSGLQLEAARFDCLQTVKILIDELCDQQTGAYSRKEWCRDLLKRGSS